MISFNLIALSIADSPWTAPLDLLALSILYIHLIESKKSASPSLVSFPTVAFNLSCLVSTSLARLLNDDDSTFSIHSLSWVVVIVRYGLLFAILRLVCTEGSGVSADQVNGWMRRRQKERMKLDMTLFGFLAHPTPVRQSDAEHSEPLSALFDGGDLADDRLLDVEEGLELETLNQDPDYQAYYELQAREDQMIVSQIASHIGVGFFTFLFCATVGLLEEDWEDGLARFALVSHMFASLPQVVLSLTEFLQPSPLLLASLAEMKQSSAHHQRYLPLTLPTSILLSLIQHIVDLILLTSNQAIHEHQAAASFPSISKQSSTRYSRIPTEILYNSILGVILLGVAFWSTSVLIFHFSRRDSIVEVMHPTLTALSTATTMTHFILFPSFNPPSFDDEVQEDEAGDARDLKTQYLNVMEEIQWKVIEAQVKFAIAGIVEREGRWKRWLLGKEVNVEVIVEIERKRWRQRRRNEPLPAYSSV
ncbi:UNVERIFIED_CONTAM: hypothetical protein HDU68_007221 [Siphonaria sp. JEL0065]|nr:hypothetical protein HDU68_007221 [Siphonaria sp. JEL0065]